MKNDSKDIEDVREWAKAAYLADRMSDDTYSQIEDALGHVKAALTPPTDRPIPTCPACRVAGYLCATHSAPTEQPACAHTAESERAAIVAWLRAQRWTWVGASAALAEAADNIEHCEHNPYIEHGAHLDQPPEVVRRMEVAEALSTGLRAALTNMLGMDGPWPLRGAIKRICQDVDHLLSHHNCDCHGYEGAIAARDSARRLLPFIDAACEALYADRVAAGNKAKAEKTCGQLVDADVIERIRDLITMLSLYTAKLKLDNPGAAISVAVVAVHDGGQGQIGPMFDYEPFHADLEAIAGPEDSWDDDLPDAMAEGVSHD